MLLEPQYVWEGDTLVVTRLDRFARSTLHLCQIAAALQHQRREGALIRTLMHDYTLSKASVYRYLRGMDTAPSTPRGQTT